MKISTLLRGLCPTCEKHKAYKGGPCWFCERAAETPEQRAERKREERDRLEAFHAAHPSLWVKEVQKQYPRTMGVERPYLRSECAEYYDTDGVNSDEDE